MWWCSNMTQVILLGIVEVLISDQYSQIIPSGNWETADI